MTASVITTLQGMAYNDMKRNWTFAKLLAVMVKQYNISVSLGEHGNTRMNEHEKVCYLPAVVKIDKLEVICTQILASAELRCNFAACCHIYTDYIKMDVAMTPHQ